MTNAKKSLTVVTNSELQTFRDCGYKWGLAYERGLRPKVAPRALAFGSAVHKGLEAICLTVGSRELVGGTETDLVTALGPVSDRAIATAFGVWFKARLDSGISLDEMSALADEAEETQAMASWMVRHYIKKNHLDWTNRIALAVELPFNVPLRDTLGRRSPVISWSGVIDNIYYDRNVDDIVVEDHKTTAGDVQSVDRRVELDPQMAGYVNSARELFASGALLEMRPVNGMGLKVMDVLKRAQDDNIATGRISYNVLRKKMPSEPKVNLNGSVSVAAIDTFAETYEAALDRQTASGRPIEQKQQELLEKLRLKGDTFLSRREFFRSDEEIARWRSEVFVDARRLRGAAKNEKERTRNPGHCTMPWSMSCSYRQICLDPTSPEHLEHFEVVSRHREVDAAQETLDSNDA